MDHPIEGQALEINRVPSSADPAFASLVAIYKEALPGSERKSPALLSQMVASPEYIFLSASLGDLVVGFTITCRFVGSDAALLEYMAVARSHRSRGIGRLLFQATAQSELIAGRFLLAEVDSDKKPSPNRETNTRRKQFYRGLGGREIELLDYIMPPVSTATPPPMDIFVFRHELPAAVEKSRLRNWLICCYVQVYGRPASDEHIDAMLDGLPDDLRLI